MDCIDLVGSSSEEQQPADSHGGDVVHGEGVLHKRVAIPHAAQYIPPSCPSYPEMAEQLEQLRQVTAEGLTSSAPGGNVPGPYLGPGPFQPFGLPLPAALSPLWDAVRHQMNGRGMWAPAYNPSYPGYQPYQSCAAPLPHSYGYPAALTHHYQPVPAMPAYSGPQAAGYTYAHPAAAAADPAGAAAAAVAQCSPHQAAPFAVSAPYHAGTEASERPAAAAERADSIAQRAGMPVKAEAEVGADVSAPTVASTPPKLRRQGIASGDPGDIMPWLAELVHQSKLCRPVVFAGL